MLLSHTAGLPHDLAHFDGGRRDPEGLEAYVRERVPRLPLVAPPGTAYVYSNAGVNVAGYVAEVVAGAFFADLMQTVLFEPLQMRRTTFDPTVVMTYPLAQGHERLDDGTLHVQHRFFHSTADNPCAGAYSTVLDLATFALLHLHNGFVHARQVLSAAAVRAMHSRQADFHQTNGAGYGLTFFLGAQLGKRRVGHGGGLGAFGSSLTLFPDDKVAIVVLSNNRFAPACSPQDVMAAIVTHVFDSAAPDAPPARPTPISPDRSHWPDYIGSYLDRQTGLATIAMVDDHLVLTHAGTTEPLHALRPHAYVPHRQSKTA